MSTRPLLSTPMISDPMSVPMIVPRPPKRLVPPRMTAAMTSSSSPAAKSGRAAWPWADEYQGGEPGQHPGEHEAADLDALVLMPQ